MQPYACLFKKFSFAYICTLIKLSWQHVEERKKKKEKKIVECARVFFIVESTSFYIKSKIINNVQNVIVTINKQYIFFIKMKNENDNYIYSTDSQF